VWLVAAPSSSLPEPALAALVRYLALSAESREQSGGVAALTQLAASRTPLAEEALERLADIDGLAERLDATAAMRLAGVAEDAEQPLRLRQNVLRLAARHRLVVLRPVVERLSRVDGPLEADALACRAEIDGGLPQARVQQFLQASDAGVRAVAARNARGSLAERELTRLVVSDPSPAVRLAAAETLAASGPTWGLEGAVSAFGDADGGVRSGATRAVAARGAEAVPFLRDALQRGGGIAAGAVATLALMGSRGTELLQQAAASNLDPKVRTLAALALGRAPGHEH
jgi:hypothetical protein